MLRSKCVRIPMVLAVMFATASALGAGDNPVARPFWGQLAGETTFDFSTDACLDVTGLPFRTVAVTEGKMSHLGRTEMFATHCQTADGSQNVGGEATFTAANGDQVWFSYTATTLAPPPDVVQEAEMIVVGGTGRFDNASGLLKGMVYVKIEDYENPPWPIQLVLAGMLTY